MSSSLSRGHPRKGGSAADRPSHPFRGLHLVFRPAPWVARADSSLTLRRVRRLRAMSPLTRSSSGRGRLALLRPVGLLGLAAVFLSCGPADVRRPNVVVWLVDTLRADHLGCYGYARPTSPNFDRLAADGVLFEQFHVHSNWTQASVTSLLSGVYPPQFTRKMADKIPPGVVLLSEWFSRHGYATYGVTQ